MYSNTIHPAAPDNARDVILITGALEHSYLLGTVLDIELYSEIPHQSRREICVRVVAITSACLYEINNIGTTKHHASY